MPTGAKRVRGQLGVVTKNVVSLRERADENAECVTQALIGQPVVAEGGQGDWLFVQTWDTYRGWIPRHAVRMLGSSLPYASSGNVAIIRELFVEILEEPRADAMIITRATISAELEVAAVYNEWVELRLPDGRSGFIRHNEARLVNRDVAQTIPLPDPRKLVQTALRFIGTPYLWGGTSPFGIDCSGFVQLVHRIHGVTLLRDAHMQAGDERGVPVEKDKIATGDLVFFSSASDSSSRLCDAKNTDVNAVTHVGIALDSKRFVHSTGHSGVIVSDLGDEMYAPKFWGARRMRFTTLDPGGGAPED